MPDQTYHPVLAVNVAQTCDPAKAPGFALTACARGGRGRRGQFRPAQKCGVFLMGAIFQFYFVRKIPDDEVAVKKGEAAIREARHIEGVRHYTGTLAECIGVELVQEIAESVAEAEERLTKMNTKDVLHIMRVRSGGYAFGAWCSW